MTANARRPFDPDASLTHLQSQTEAAPLPLPLDPEASLTRLQAAEFLTISPGFLKKLDLAGEGPPAYRIGRRWTYLRRDLLAWRETFRVGSPIAVPPAANSEAPPPPPAVALPPPKRGRPRREAAALREVA